MHDFCSSRSGVTAIEYAMIAGLMAAALLMFAPRIGAALDGAFGASHFGGTRASPSDTIQR